MLDCSEPGKGILIRPCLAEFFRTCVYPPSLHLRVEKIVVELCNREGTTESSENGHPSGGGRESVHRLFLSDGVLVVQALLESHLLPLMDLRHAVAGDTIVLKRFRIKRAERLNGQGDIVFLGIADCDIVRSEAHARQTELKKRSATEHLQSDHEEDVMPPKRVRLSTPSISSSCELATTRKRPDKMAKSAWDSDSDDFETSTFDHSKLDGKRKALQELKSNQSLGSPKTVMMENVLSAEPKKQSLMPRVDSPRSTVPAGQTTGLPDLKTRPTHPSRPSHCNQQLHQPAASTSPHHQRTQPAPPVPHQPQQFQQPIQRDPPYHTLLSLLSPDLHSRHPLPTKSYPCTIFAVISWVSATIIHPRPHSPFPAKRHIKIHDPSIASRHAGVTVAVFCDARDFRPQLGTVAVFRGVVMQKTVGGDVILNAYERLMREPGVDGKVGRWLEDDERVLAGLGWDVSGLRGWWKERGRSRGGRIN